MYGHRDQHRYVGYAEKTSLGLISPRFCRTIFMSVAPHKFEADRSIRSEVIRGSQNFEIGSRDPGHVHLGVV